MTKYIQLLILIGIIFISVFFGACKKENMDTTQIDEPEIPIDTSLCDISVAIMEVNSGGNNYLTTNLTGGQTPFSYLWSQGATSEDIIVTTDGNYSITVTDGEGCTAEATYTYSTSNPCASLMVDITYAVDSTGNNELFANSTGGTSPYSYQWSEGSTTQEIVVTANGAFTVTLTDNLGCTAEDNYQF